MAGTTASWPRSKLPLLRASLAATGGNQIRAARLLGINRNTLRKKLLDRGVDPGAIRG